MVTLKDFVDRLKKKKNHACMIQKNNTARKKYSVVFISLVKPYLSTLIQDLEIAT